MANMLTLFTSRKCIIYCLTTGIKILKINNHRRTPSWVAEQSYAHALSPVKSELRDFLWDIGPMNVTISRQRIDFVC